MPRRQKILFLAANPTNLSKLALDQEAREILDKLDVANAKQPFDLETRWAVRIDDLQEHLLKIQPDIVHFSGHGGGVSGLCLQDEKGHHAQVGAGPLGALFRILQDDARAGVGTPVRCVVLNACYSEVQARAIAEHVDHVVGMSNAILDNAALKFAAGFYQALTQGRPVASAWKLACNQIDLHSIGQEAIPLLVHRGADGVRVERYPS